jgi:PIN domain nuclease of toxin-antitoxin system
VKLLLDTVTFLWIAADDPRVSQPALAAFRSPANEVFLSAVSAWEVALKHGLGKLPLPEVPDRFVPDQRQRLRVQSLELFEAAALAVTKLPRHHADPFDRMLVCQALMGGLTLVTPDPLIHAYPVSTLW